MDHSEATGMDTPLCKGGQGRPDDEALRDGHPVGVVLLAALFMVLGALLQAWLGGAA